MSLMSERVLKDSATLTGDDEFVCPWLPSFALIQAEGVPSSSFPSFFSCKMPLSLKFLVPSNCALWSLLCSPWTPSNFKVQHGNRGEGSGQAGTSSRATLLFLPLHTGVWSILSFEESILWIKTAFLRQREYNGNRNKPMVLQKKNWSLLIIDLSTSLLWF